jgi:DNA-binding MarR family transcriptional regulator
MKIKTLLAEPNKHLVKELHDGLARHGYDDVRPAHSQVFQYLEREGSRITMLAEKAQMTKQSMSVLVSDMERAGYLMRMNDKDDKRAFIFKLTPKGMKMYELAGKLIKEITGEWEAKLGTKKMNELIRLLSELNEKIAG